MVAMVFKTQAAPVLIYLWYNPIRYPGTDQPKHISVSKKALFAAQPLFHCMFFSCAYNWTANTLCAGLANLRWMWGLEGPLDIQTLYNSANSDLKFRAWPGLLWEAKKQAMPAALDESKGVKKAGRSFPPALPPSLRQTWFLYSRHPCTWCLRGVSGSSVS